MARTRQLVDLRADVRKRADIENATDRHPDADLDRYINQGGAALRDLMIEVRGRQYFRKSPPQTITTLGNTSRYALATDFYRLISVRIQGPGGMRLVPFIPEDEPWLREPTFTVSKPTHYELQPGYIECLPLHSAGWTIVVDYIPVYTDLVNGTDTLDGLDGWEEYVVNFAARCCAVKDEEYELIQALEQDMARLERRIKTLAPGRDSFRAERVKDVRGDVLFGIYGRRRWW